MAKLNDLNLTFGLSPSQDVVNYRLRIFPTGATPNPNAVYSAPFAEVGTDGVIDAVEIQGIAGNPDGVFDLYLTALDDGGNESDYAVKVAVPLDVIAPEPPTWN